MIVMRSLSRTLLTCAALFASSPASDAHACSVPPCTPAQLFPSGGSIPTDRVRLRYQPSFSYADLASDAGVVLPHMYRLEGSTKVVVPFESESDGARGMWLTPVVTQPIGAQLVVETDASSCSLDVPLSATYSITEARALPNTLGTVQATVKRALLPIAVGLGACSETADVSYADLIISLGDQAQPFAAVFRYQLYVDEQPHATFIDNSVSSHRLPQGTDRVYAQCADIDAGPRGTVSVTPGVHTVHFRAQIGDEPALESERVSINLACEGTAPTHPYDGGFDTPEAKLSGSCALADGRGQDSWLFLVLLGLKLRQLRQSRTPRHRSARIHP